IESWQRLLGVEQLGVEDNFFEMGGDSLLAVRLMSEIRKVFRLDLPIHSLLDSPTVKQLAELIERALTDKPKEKTEQDNSVNASAPSADDNTKLSALNSEIDLSSSLVNLQAGKGGPPLFLIHPAGGTVFCYR